MSKIITKKSSTLKSLYQTNKNSINNNINDIAVINGLKMKPLTKNNNSMLFNNNIINNNQINSKHFSPLSNRVKSSFPPVISNNNYNKNKDNNNDNNQGIVSSQKKNRNLQLVNSNSLKDMHFQKNIISPRIGKFIGREKTQADISQNLYKFNDIPNSKKGINDIFFLNHKADIVNNDKKNKNIINNLKQINNINNINNLNINIYSNKINDEIENDKKTNNNMSLINENNNISLINNITNDNINEKNLISGRINLGLNRKKNSKSFALTPKKEFLKELKEYVITENKINPIKSKFINNQNSDSNIENPETSSLFNNINIKEKKIHREISTDLKTISPISILTNDFEDNTKDDTIKKNCKSSTLKLVGNLVIKDNKEKTKKILNKRYQSEIYDNVSYFDDKNITRNMFNINNDNDIKKIISTESNIINNNKEEFNMINEATNYLKEFNEKNDNIKILLIFIKLIQIHIDIELILDNNASNNFRRRVTSINNDRTFKLNSLINNYFNNLTYLQKYCRILDKDSNNKLSNNNTINNTNNNLEDQNNLSISNSQLFPSYNIFTFSLLNSIFHKCIKIQMCFYSAFIVSLSQLSNDDIDKIIKSHFHKIIKEISSPLYTFYKAFLMDEIKEKYNKIISNNLRPDFLDNFNKLYTDEKLISSLKKSEIFLFISSNMNKCIDSLKNYSNSNLRNSIIKPFGDALNQMLLSLSKKSLDRFIDIFINMILYGELYINKQKMQKNLEDTNNIKSTKNKKKNKNIYLGSAIYNNVKDTAPYLPEINKKYKFTLVLDMDETLVHFFFTTMNGMFFVRPYCLEFLNELNNYYEIVTFTAGLKDYADNILNLLDINDNVIKYRLYRQHVTIAGFTSYKDLKLLGRDLKKIIIIDNLKENFRMQPDNGLFIKTWTSDVNDKQFKDLLVILKSIAINDVSDVRPIIQRINEKIKDNGDLINPYAKINIKNIIDDEKK